MTPGVGKGDVMGASVAVGGAGEGGGSDVSMATIGVSGLIGSRVGGAGRVGEGSTGAGVVTTIAGGTGTIGCGVAVAGTNTLAGVAVAAVGCAVKMDRPGCDVA